MTWSCSRRMPCLTPLVGLNLNYSNFWTLGLPPRCFKSVKYLVTLDVPAHKTARSLGVSNTYPDFRRWSCPFETLRSSAYLCGSLPQTLQTEASQKCLVAGERSNLSQLRVLQNDLHRRCVPTPASVLDDCLQAGAAPSCSFLGELLEGERAHSSDAAAARGLARYSCCRSSS